jgi:hypothetical protein
MKFPEYFLHLAIFFFIVGESVIGGDVAQATLHRLGEKYEIELTQENLKMSKWDQKSELPLAVNKIIEIARAEVSKRYPAKESYLLDSLKLEAFSEENEHWCYFAVFVSSNIIGSPRGGAGTPRAIMLLLDGTVINSENKQSSERGDSKIQGK